MSHTELIALAKDGEYIEVHPTTLENHVELGWHACERREVAELAADVPKPKTKKAGIEPAADATANKAED